MEWIAGTKLTDVQGSAGTNATHEDAVKEENLALVKVAIDSTLSQLLVTGVLHGRYCFVFFQCMIHMIFSFSSSNLMFSFSFFISRPNLVHSRSTCRELA